MDEKELREYLAKFTRGKDFQVNPDKKISETLIKGILYHQDVHGKRFCPCRMPESGITCPCNFKKQDEWHKHGRCLCRLFVKKQ